MFLKPGCFQATTTIFGLNCQYFGPPDKQTTITLIHTLTLLQLPTDLFKCNDQQTTLLRHVFWRQGFSYYIPMSFRSGVIYLASTYLFFHNICNSFNPGEALYIHLLHHRFWEFSGKQEPIVHRNSNSKSGNRQRVFFLSLFSSRHDSGVSICSSADKRGQIVGRRFILSGLSRIWRTSALFYYPNFILLER